MIKVLVAIISILIGIAGILFGKSESDKRKAAEDRAKKAEQEVKDIATKAEISEAAHVEHVNQIGETVLISGCRCLMPVRRRAIRPEGLQASRVMIKSLPMTSRSWAKRMDSKEVRCLNSENSWENHPQQRRMTDEKEQILPDVPDSDLTGIANSLFK